MERQMAETISGNLDSATAQKLKIAAANENRSVSNAVASAVAIFVDLPKGFRDLMLELHSKDDHESIRKLGRELMAATARLRLEQATSDLARERLFGGAEIGVSEIDMMEEATRLTKDAMRKPR
jgi:hypothetical protein